MSRSLLLCLTTHVTVPLCDGLRKHGAENEEKEEEEEEEKEFF
jgi:hypothetical protein